MNPSYADEGQSDRTVNRIVDASIDGRYSGWVMLNLYPQRATRPEDLGAFDPLLSTANCAAIEQIITKCGATDVLGAWGDPPNQAIKLAKLDVLQLLAKLRVKVFHLDDLTRKGEPRHPTPRSGRLLMAGPKRYLT